MLVPCVLFKLAQYTGKVLFQADFFYSAYSFWTWINYSLRLSNSKLGSFFQYLKCKQKQHLSFPYTTNIYEIFTINFGWLSEMSIWSIVNIKNGKTNVDFIRYHAPLITSFRRSSVKRRRKMFKFQNMSGFFFTE